MSGSTFELVLYKAGLLVTLKKNVKKSLHKSVIVKNKIVLIKFILKYLYEKRFIEKKNESNNNDAKTYCTII